MANNKSKKKKSEQSAQASSVKAETKKAAESKDQAKKATSKQDKAAKKAAKKKADKNKKPGFFGKVKNYFSAVRSEMKRVVWPSKKELGNYTVAVIASLIVVGVVIAVIDMLLSGGLAALSSLRG